MKFEMFSASPTSLLAFSTVFSDRATQHVLCCIDITSGKTLTFWYQNDRKLSSYHANLRNVTKDILLKKCIWNLQSFPFYRSLVLNVSVKVSKWKKVSQKESTKRRFVKDFFKASSCAISRIWNAAEKKENKTSKTLSTIHFFFDWHWNYNWIVYFESITYWGVRMCC